MPITTYTGNSISFDINKMSGNKISIIDIAHHLSLLNRFVGATEKAYSTAEHSFLVSLLVPKEFAMAGLLHDAHEAYTGDINSDFKRHLGFPLFNIVRELDLLIYRKFNVKMTKECKKYVKFADHQARRFEGERLMPLGNWSMYPKTSKKVEVNCYPPEIAQQMFLMQFTSLGGTINETLKPLI